jgi:hypothetical protein
MIPMLVGYADDDVYLKILQQGCHKIYTINADQPKRRKQKEAIQIVKDTELTKQSSNKELKHSTHEKDSNKDKYQEMPYSSLR